MGTLESLKGLKQYTLYRPWNCKGSLTLIEFWASHGLNIGRDVCAARAVLGFEAARVPGSWSHVMKGIMWYQGPAVPRRTLQMVLDLPWLEQWPVRMCAGTATAGFQGGLGKGSRF